MIRRLIICTLALLIAFVPAANALSILPTPVPPTVREPAPSYGKMANVLPGNITTNSDASVTVRYDQVTEARYAQFGEYLAQRGWSAAESEVSENSLTATLAKNADRITVKYDYSNREECTLRVTYPAGIEMEEIVRYDDFTFLKKGDRIVVDEACAVTVEDWGFVDSYQYSSATSNPTTPDEGCAFFCLYLSVKNLGTSDAYISTLVQQTSLELGGNDFYASSNQYGIRKSEEGEYFSGNTLQQLVERRVVVIFEPSEQCKTSEDGLVVTFVLAGADERYALSIR